MPESKIDWPEPPAMGGVMQRMAAQADNPAAILIADQLKYLAEVIKTATDALVARDS